MQQQIDGSRASNSQRRQLLVDARRGSRRLAPAWRRA
jgi:hypothetical protein